METRKFLSIMLVLCVLLISFVSAENSPTNQLNGFVSTQENGNLNVLAELSNITLNKSGESIEMSFNYNNDLVSISASESNIDSKNSLVYYNGKASIGENNYYVSLVSNEHGISGLIYNNDRSMIIPFSISKDGNMKDKAKQYNKTLNQLKEEGKWKGPNIKIDISNIEETDLSISPLSTIYYKSVRITYDGYTIPFVLSAGSVDGVLYYQTGTQIQIENPEAKFYAERLEGVVNWNTGFDLISIMNPNEPYGYLFSTPTWPPRVMTIWDINEYACYSGTYELKGQISYTILVDKAPVLFTDSKRVAIY